LNSWQDSLRFPSCFLRAFLLLAGCLGFTSSSFSQEARQESLESFRRRNVSTAEARGAVLLDQQSADIGELALVQKSPKAPLLSVSTVQSFFHTDNVFLSDSDRRESLAWHGQFLLDIVPYSTYQWTPRLRLEQNLVRYDRESSQDFNGQNPSLSSRIDLTEDKSWSWDTGFWLSRLVAAHTNSDVFYREVAFGNSLTYFKPVSRDRRLYFLGDVDLTWRHASPSEFDRLDYGLTLNLIYYARPQFSLQPFLRPALYLFTNDTAAQQNRHDFNLTAGLSGTWTPSRFLSLSSAVTWTRNHSSAAAQDYSVTVPAVSLFLSVQY
jgi:hypothetical protein